MSLNFHRCIFSNGINDFSYYMVKSQVKNLLSFWLEIERRLWNPTLNSGKSSQLPVFPTAPSSYSCYAYQMQPQATSMDRDQSLNK